MHLSIEARRAASMSKTALLATLCVCLGLAGSLKCAHAQDGLQPGEGYVTRFSGTKTEDGKAVIDTDGTVGSIIDLRNPAQAPRGQHWLNEPQRNPVTAAEVGQVFGIALDDADLPNVYLTATSAFGLHRTSDNDDWMTGMWGPDAGPGTVWKLDGANDYSPSVFATIALDGRANTGAALGNIAYDKWNKQLYVSDLETGMIHRLSLDGTDLGHFDHGTEGRASFIDASTGEQSALPEVAFDPDSAAQIDDCTAGTFSASPECWNFADFRRRVWGVGVRQDPDTEEVRLYYAVWSSQALGSKDFDSAGDDEKRNSLWSVAIAEDGSFDTTSVRREFFLPDFFTDPADIARAGLSNPVSDIAFSECIDQNVMLLAERGGVRNLGLDTEEPFATPHEARVLRYELDDNGIWQLQGRYDVGFYDRKNEHEPFVRANSSGGVDFGYGYTVEWKIDIDKPDEFVWMTGDSLCSPYAPCFVPDTGLLEDGSEVHGVQGTPAFAFEELLPTAALQPYPDTGEPYAANGPLQSWMIDTDLNVDADNKVIMESLTKNDATKIGDIEIYEICVGEGEPEAVEEEEEVVEEEEEIIEELPPGVEYPPTIWWPPTEDGPDLVKDKTGPAECIEGGICTFTITITNNGPGIWSGPLWEMETLPPGAILWDYAPQPDWTCNQPLGSDNVFCNHVWVTLLPGESVTLTKDVLLPWGIAGETVENCVIDLWLPSWDPDDPDVILLVEQALFALGYVTGPIDGVLDIVTIAAITQYQIDNGLPATGVIDDVLLASLFPGSAGAPGDLDPDNDWDCHEVLILPAPIFPLAAPPPGGPAIGLPPPPDGVQEPDIEVTKDQLTAQCLPGGLCSFEIRFTNRGPGVWTGFPAITDTLPDGATLVGWSAWFCTQAGNTVTCLSPFETTLAPGESRSITITVRMPDDLAPGAENCVEADLPVGIADAGPDNNRVCEPVVVGPEEPEPDLWDPKVQTTVICQPGGLCSFDLWLVNLGPVAWTGEPVLEDELPEGVTLQSRSDPWSCEQSGTTVTCTRSELTLEPGQGTRVNITVRLPDDAKPGTENCVRIKHTEPDPVPQNDEFCIPINIAEPAPTPTPTPVEPPVEPSVPPTDISVEKSQVGTCEAGGICVFEITFTNEGPGEWPSVLEVVDTLPPGATLVNPPVGCTQAGNTVTCRYPQTVILPPNSTGSVTITVRMPDDLEPGAENCVRIKHTEPDPVPQNDESCIPIDIAEPAPEPIEPPIEPPIPPSDTSIEKSQVGTCKAGGVCIFEITFTNEGPGEWTGKPHITDTLIPGTKVTYAFPTSWQCETAGTSHACEHEEVTLEAGESMSLLLSIIIPADMTSDEENCAKIEPPAEGPVDPNEENDEDCVPVTVTPEPEPEPEPEPYEPHPPTPVPVPSDEIAPQVSCEMSAVEHNGHWATTWEYNITVNLGGADKCAVSYTQDHPESQGDWVWCGYWFQGSKPTQTCSDLVNDHSFTGWKVRAICNGKTIIVSCTPPPKVYVPKPPTIVTPPVTPPEVYEPPHEPPHKPPVVVPEPVCPSGTYWEDGYCVAPIPIPIPIPPIGCPPGWHKEHGHCVKPCPHGYIKKGRKCIKPTPPHKCRPGWHRVEGHCVKRTERCGPGMRRVDGHCVKIKDKIKKKCPAGTHRKDGRCVKDKEKVKRCPKGTKPVGGKCVKVHKPSKPKKPHVKPKRPKKPHAKPKRPKKPHAKPKRPKKPHAKPKRPKKPHAKPKRPKKPPKKKKKKSR